MEQLTSFVIETRKMSLKRITEENFSGLLRSMDPSFDLLGRLRSVAFVKDRISLIKQQSTDDQKNDALLSALLEVPDDIQESVMNGLIKALRDSGQDHVANIFRRDNDKVIMSYEHYELLSTKRRDLCKFMNPEDELIDYLISLKIFSEADNRSIFSKAGLNEMAKATVTILLRKSDCAFYVFLDALNDTNQSHVSYLLTGVGNPPMSDQHREMLHAKVDNIGNFMDVESGLLDGMMIHGVFTVHDDEQVRSVRNQNAMAKRLVEILRRKSDEAFYIFIALLCETGQSHVAYILTGEGHSRPLKEEYRIRLLSRPRDDLVKTIDSKHTNLISALMDKGVFSSYDEQRVTSVWPDTIDDRNEVILNLIARKSQSDFVQFVSALNETGQTHVVVELIGADIVAKIKTVYESGTHESHIPGVDAELLGYMKEMFQCNGVVVRQLNKLLSQRGVSVSDVRPGCIEVVFTCKRAEYVRDFRDLYDSGELENTLNEAFCSQFVQKGLIFLRVEILSEQFEQCVRTFSRWMPMNSKHRETLQSSEKLLVDKVMVSNDLLDKLSLCPRRTEAIKSAGTQKQQVKTLLNIVSRQTFPAFTELYDALRDTRQTEAADIISADSSSASMRKAHKAQPLRSCDSISDSYDSISSLQVPAAAADIIDSSARQSNGMYM